jgi:hypothetical protein
VVWRSRTGGDWGAKGFLLGVRRFFYLSFFFFLFDQVSVFFIIPGNDISLWVGSGLITERALRVIGRSTFFLSE